MQRVACMGLLGSFSPVVHPQPVDLATLVVQARKADPVAPAAQRKAAAPARRPLAPPQESRPAGARLNQRGSFSGVLGRLNDGDPVLLAHLRRNPDEARRLASYLDRLLLEV